MSSVYLVLVVHHNPGILKWTSALSEIKPKIPSKTVIMIAMLSQSRMFLSDLKNRYKHL